MSWEHNTMQAMICAMGIRCVSSLESVYHHIYLVISHFFELLFFMWNSMNLCVRQETVYHLQLVQHIFNYKCLFSSQRILIRKWTLTIVKCLIICTGKFICHLDLELGIILIGITLVVGNRVPRSSLSTLKQQHQRYIEIKPRSH